MVGTPTLLLEIICSQVRVAVPVNGNCSGFTVVDVKRGVGAVFAKLIKNH